MSIQAQPPALICPNPTSRIETQNPNTAGPVLSMPPKISNYFFGEDSQ
jgi:hypothetical protein